VGGPVTDAGRLARAVERHRPDVLLLESTLLERLEPPSLRRIQRCPQVRVLLVADEDAATAALMLRHGFQGLLSAASPTYVCLKAIRAVKAGELWLSRRLMAAALTDASWPARPAPSPGPANPESVAESKALTVRERQVVSRLRQGRSNKEIARELGIVEDTVKKHLKSVYAKLGVRRRAMVILRPTA
jgi:DNA-binding NarL/FixJ family response regulator